MKTKLIGVLALLAGSTLFAAPRVVVGLGIGVPAYGYAAPAPVVVAPPPPPVYGYVAPAPVAVAPAPVYPGRVWIDGYWGFAGGRRVWYPGYWGPRPVYRGGWHR
jgi:hypothetical protein